MNPRTFTEQMLFSTLRLQLLDDSGEPGPVGTGFLVHVQFPTHPNHSTSFLVSNKHVFNDCRPFVVNFHRRKNGADEADLTQVLPVIVKDYSKSYFAHSNPNVDLACINLASVIRLDRADAYYKCLDLSLFSNFEERELDVGQRVVFVGYPENRYDQVHNLPILRSGVIASHPKVDFNGVPQFIIDAQVFPGSSGSPVFLNLKEAQFNRGQIIMGPNLPMYAFIGVVSATMIKNNVVNFLPTQLTPHTHEVIGLGLVFKATALKDLIQSVLDFYFGNRPQQSPNGA